MSIFYPSYFPILQYVGFHFQNGSWLKMQFKMSKIGQKVSIDFFCVSYRFWIYFKKGVKNMINLSFVQNDCSNKCDCNIFYLHSMANNFEHPNSMKLWDFHIFVVLKKHCHLLLSIYCHQRILYDTTQIISNMQFNART